MSAPQVSNPFFNNDHDAFRAAVRDFVSSEITPNAHEWDVAGEFPRELYKKAGALDLFGDGFSAEYGGHGQRDALMRMVIMQELSRSGSGGVVAGMLSNYIGLPPVEKYGSHELKSKVLPPCMAGEHIGALAITEPSGGSDVARIRTSAKRDGDHYVINGSKTFITSGMRADWITTAVRTGGDGPSGISMIVIPGDSDGLSRTKLDKMGWLASDTATLYFDDVRVPVENILGEENSGFTYIVTNFNAERIDLATQSVTFARLCYEAALDWARERHTFGKRLADHQVIRHKLVDMDRRINACEAWLEVSELAAQPGRRPCHRDRRGQGRRHPHIRVLRPRSGPGSRRRQLPAR